MHLVRRVTRKVLKSGVPRRTVRLRLTLLYGGLFLVSSAALLIITAILWNATSSQITLSAGPFGRILQVVSRSPVNVPPGVSRFSAGTHVSGTLKGVRIPPGATPAQGRVVAGQLNFVATQQHSSDLHQLLIYCAIAIAIMAMVSIALGWWIAGRVLRPLRTITSTARDISATNLHERLELDGPDDELKELGDTIDQLLGRLERSFQSQRQFVANASHELRTPLTTMRATLDVATAKPGPVSEGTKVLADRLREELDQVDRLLENFLLLARAQTGPMGDDVPQSLDLLVASALEDHEQMIFEMDLDVRVDRDPKARVTGNETLLVRMVTNMIDNAVLHNHRHGWIRVRTEVEGDIARLVVQNGGAALDENAVKELVRPFRRLGAERTGSDSGTGLGLSIVAAIAESHGGRIELHALEGGGFQVVVELPVALRELTGAPA